MWFTRDYYPANRPLGSETILSESEKGYGLLQQNANLLPCQLNMPGLCRFPVTPVREKNGAATISLDACRTLDPSK
ncbi:Delta(12) fatty acid desaturase [Venturia inaequalis]|nr:Delta(12) fatty acid desaturase [Venturia inaequalis]